VWLETQRRFWEGVCMSEIIFEVREAEEGGFWARALGYSIFTQGEDWDDLRRMVKDAVACHFEQEAERPKVIRLHYVRDEVLAA
jgi:predicted RNase H-like HicB family nuclease